MFLHERYQVHCPHCFKTFEADTIPQAMTKADEHLAECEHRPAPPVKTTRTITA